jgi:hypothetical protein
MDRRFLTVSVVAGLVALAGSPLSAGLYPFSAELSFVSPAQPEGMPVTGADAYLYEQSLDVPGGVDWSAGERVVEAFLTLTFQDEPDEGDKPLQIGHQKNEVVTVRVATDGAFGTWLAQGLGEVDDGAYPGPDLAGYLSWLNDDGKLGVEVRLDYAGQDIYLRSSTLSGTAQTALMPVPAGVLLGLLGLCTAGLKLRRAV